FLTGLLYRCTARQLLDDERRKLIKPAQDDLDVLLGPNPSDTGNVAIRSDVVISDPVPQGHIDERRADLLSGHVLVTPLIQLCPRFLDVDRYWRFLHEVVEEMERRTVLPHGLEALRPIIPFVDIGPMIFGISQDILLPQLVYYLDDDTMRYPQFICQVVGPGFPLVLRQHGPSPAGDQVFHYPDSMQFIRGRNDRGGLNAVN